MAAVARAADVLLSVRRALTLLDLLAAAPEGRGVTEVARELGIHKSNASRLLATLRASGLVNLDASSGRFELGSGLLRLAARVMQRLDLAQLASPFLRDLTARSGETAYLSVRRGEFRVAIQEIQSPNPVRMVAGIGHPYPLYAGASGKVLLASLPDAEITAVIRSMPRDRARAGGTTRFREQLEQVRRDGYAVTFEENIPGASSIAVPVRGHLGTVVAALGIAGVVPRWNRERMLETLPVLRQNAQEIGELLGQVRETGGGLAPPDRRGEP